MRACAPCVRCQEIFRPARTKRTRSFVDKKLRKCPRLGRSSTLEMSGMFTFSQRPCCDPSEVRISARAPCVPRSTGLSWPANTIITGYLDSASRFPRTRARARRVFRDNIGNNARSASRSDRRFPGRSAARLLALSPLPFASIPPKYLPRAVSGSGGVRGIPPRMRGALASARRERLSRTRATNPIHDRVDAIDKSMPDDLYLATTPPFLAFLFRLCFSRATEENRALISVPRVSRKNRARSRLSPPPPSLSLSPPPKIYRARRSTSMRSKISHVLRRGRGEGRAPRIQDRRVRVSHPDRPSYYRRLIDIERERERERESGAGGEGLRARGSGMDLRRIVRQVRYSQGYNTAIARESIGACAIHLMASPKQSHWT